MDVVIEPQVSWDSLLLANSDVWYAEELRQLFPGGIEIIANWQHDELFCLPEDITTFSIEARRNTDYGTANPALEITGSLTLGAIPESFSVFDGANGRKYLLNLNAYLLNTQGNVVWSIAGYRIGEDAWVHANGSTSQFRLINGYDGSFDGYRVLLIASGDPIFASFDSWISRVILGVGEFRL